MEFEFDAAKSTANREKHGIDFLEAQMLWKGVATVRPLPFKGEDRQLRVGLIGDKLWAAVFTWRGDRVRLISVRRARQEEEARYGREIGIVRRDNHQP